MKHILIIFIPIILLTSTLFGQSSKPLGVVLPPIVKGNVSDTRKQFLLNTLYDELSKYFDFSSLPQIESGDCLVGCDVFQLQIVEEDGNTQFSLRWMNENFRRIETKLCGGCKTIELNGKLKELVEKLVRGKKIETVVVVEKRRKGVLFHRLVNGEFRWFGNGDEEKDGKYVGEFKDGKKHGQGTLTFTDGRNGVGEWRGNKPWNITEYNKNGNITGKYVNGLKVEKRRKVVLFEREVDGVLGWYENGDEREDTKFVGEIKNGKQNGEGTQTYPDGRKYVGEFKNGLLNGQGTFTSPDGRKYVGEFKEGKRNGQGTQTSPDGGTYIGEWKDGKQNGQGTLTFTDGGKYVGEWKNGEMSGQGTKTWTNGDMYEGKFKDGKHDGQGTYTWFDGRKYVGEWKDGETKRSWYCHFTGWEVCGGNN